VCIELGKPSGAAAALTRVGRWGELCPVRAEVRDSRRRLALALAASALLVQACRCGGEPPSPPSPEPVAKDAGLRCPGCNAILISIDTLRADHLGCYGYARETSPNIDELAARSLVFTDATSQSSWTTPAHASMFSGAPPSEHGLVYFRNPGVLSEETDTLAEILARNGYRTVSYNGAGYVSARFGLGQGFEIYESRSRNFEANIAAAEKWIGENRDRPFFLFLHGYDVHRPYTMFKYNTFCEYEGDFDILKFCTAAETRKRPGDRELEYVVAQYDAGIVWVDLLLGRFFRFLDDAGLRDDTVIIVTSDHGEEFYEHGGCDHKHSVYRELVHVPLIIALPSGVARRVDVPVPASTAILPTVLSIVGVEPEGPARSTDLVRVAATGRYDGDPIESETGRLVENLQHWKGITTARWKLIYEHDCGETSFELYDRTGDAMERDDVFGERRGEVEGLIARMLTDGGITGEPREGAAPEQRAIEDRELVEQLEALGYME